MPSLPKTDSTSRREACQAFLDAQTVHHRSMVTLAAMQCKPDIVHRAFRTSVVSQWLWHRMPRRICHEQPVSRTSPRLRNHFGLQWMQLLHTMPSCWPALNERRRPSRHASLTLPASWMRRSSGKKKWEAVQTAMSWRACGQRMSVCVKSWQKNSSWGRKAVTMMSISPMPRSCDFFSGRRIHRRAGTLLVTWELRLTPVTSRWIDEAVWVLTVVWITALLQLLHSATDSLLWRYDARVVNFFGFCLTSLSVIALDFSGHSTEWWFGIAVAECLSVSFLRAKAATAFSAS